jgi:hypothetical protein
MRCYDFKKTQGLSFWRGGGGLTVNSNKKKEIKPRYDPGLNHSLKKPYC